MDAYLGEVRRFAFNFAPTDWAPCDGATLPIMQHQALFAILGTNFGGDGRTTFALPKIAAADGINAYIATNGTFPTRP